MATRPHFTDLQRRYREPDWVSEFQRLWAIFNHWLVSYSGQTRDRDCIEYLKLEPNLNHWLNDIIQATAYRRPERISDGYGGSYPRFAADNEISRFFRAVRTSPVVEPRINYPWRVETSAKVRIIHAITIDESQFRRAYEAHAQVLDENIANFHLTIHQTLPTLGIHTTGCCFYRGPVAAGMPPGMTKNSARMVDLFRSSLCLDNLVNLINSQHPTNLGDDIIETLYNVRNVAMHGSLDFLNKQDNAAARAAYDLLDLLIRDIRDRW